VASSFTTKLARMVLEGGKDPLTLLNVNVPNLRAESISRVKITKLGNRVYRDLLIKKVDPRGKNYYWIGGDEPSWKSAEETDCRAVEEGMISVTPLMLDMTDYDKISEMEGLNLKP